MLRSLLSRTGIVILACVVALNLAACAGGQPSRFYILNALSGPEKQERTAGSATGISVGVGPVKVPEYLDRVQIVTRTTSNTLQLAEFDRWAEPLDRSLPRMLAENLSVLLPADNVASFPWPGSARVDYQVVVEVIQFDGILGQKAWLEARWTILSEGGKQVRLRRNASIGEPVDDPSHEALVSAWSRALADLSREIAASLQTVARNAPK
jgi:uncharacterized lipoprotein YmbA